MGFIFLDCSQTQTIQVSKEIEEFYSSYNKAWSNADLNFISEEIYAVPFTLYLNDTTLMFFTKDEVKTIKDALLTCEWQNGKDLSLIHI